MNHKAPIKNDTLLREAYESGRLQALNEASDASSSSLGRYVDPGGAAGPHGGYVTPNPLSDPKHPWESWLEYLRRRGRWGIHPGM